jgi:phage baseplate assembly protein V
MDPRSARQLIERALNSVRQAVRGRLQRAGAGKQVILVQAEGLAGETFNNAEFFQHPGLRSVPLAEMQTIVIPLGGRSANGVVIATSNGKLFISDLQPGEVAIFNESDGEANSIVMRNGKVIDIKCATLNIEATAAVNITAPSVQLKTTSTRIEASTVDIQADTTTVSGDVDVDKTVTAATDVIGAGTSLHSHVHKAVSSGTSESGPPK